jgi:uncharacterized RDD family membrane protein YckC
MSPGTGPGSLAAFGQRLGAFAVDAVLSALVAALFTAPELPRDWSLLVLVAEYLLFTVLVGQTPGMRLVGLRVIRFGRPGRVNPWQAAVRTLGVVLVVPALIPVSDGRSLHDRLAGTAIVRA